MKIYLAPMEGVVDSIMRETLTSVGGFDYCVTEFLRVTGQVYPEHMFFRYCPELEQEAQTKSQTPVHFQLLGGNPELLAQNAVIAVKLGAPSIDLNFGCPAKTVNKHDGGASLLQFPDRIFNIVKAVRQAVPQPTPVSAKIRLGYQDKSLVIENSQSVEEAGASWLVVHARTKVEGYKPPAHWEWIARINEKVSLPVIANGDIWTLEDYLECSCITQCEDVMLGRGAISRPDLALQIKKHKAGEEYQPYTWKEVQPLVKHMFHKCWAFGNARYPVTRTKQWSKFLSRSYPEALELFENIKRHRDPEPIAQIIENSVSKKHIP